MANISENRINTTIAEATLTEILDNINAVKDGLPGGGDITLTDQQRTTMMSMSVDNLVFVQEAITVMAQSGDSVLPGYLNTPSLKNDATLHQQLGRIEGALLAALQCVQDLRRVTAHEAASMAFTIYNSYKMAAKSGIPNATTGYERLRHRFEGQRSGGAPVLQE